MCIRFLSILTLLFSLSQAAHPDSSAFISEDGRELPGPKCDCYTISGPDPGYFTHYRFWDFRTVPLDPEVAKNFNFHPSMTEDESNDFNDFDDSIEHLEERNAKEQPVFLKDTPFAADWQIQDWRRKGTRLFPITVVNSDKNVFISKSENDGKSTFLTLRNTRLDSYSSTAEIETAFKDVFHVSMRVRFRLLQNDEPMLVPPVEEVALVDVEAIMPESDAVSLTRRNARRFPPPNGACAGIFTYYSTTSESDIEILTADPPNRVHYANQPDYDPIADRIIPGASEAKDVPVPWTAWATHRLDWLPNISRWYVENELQASNTYSVPQDPSMLIINLWSDGGLWSGNLTVGESVHMGIEWIEIAYNVSSSLEERGERSKREEKEELHIPYGGQWVLSDLSGFEPTDSSPELDGKWQTKRAGQCRRVCRIDNLQHDGIPELVT